MSIKNWSEYTKGKLGATWFPEEILDKYAKGKILDIGCGTGKHLAKIKNFEEKHGIDPSELGIEEAKKNCPECRFAVGSTYSLSFPDNNFDFIFSVDTIEHLKSPEKMLIEAKRVLKPDGVFVIQTPNYPIKRVYDFINWLNPRKKWKKSLKDDPTHVSKFSYFKLKKILGSYFQVLEIRPRNILLEGRILFLKKLKNNFLGKIIGQKVIIICRK